MRLDQDSEHYDAWQDAINEERNLRAWDGLRCRCGEGCAVGRCQFIEADDDEEDC